MRFSAALTSLLPVTQPVREVARVVRATPAPAEPETIELIPRDLPLELDQRVRLIGEW